MSSIPLSEVTRISRGASPVRAKFWRSVDELAQSDDIRVWLHREFPEKADEFTDPEGRRRFLQLMGASVALAGLSGACTRQPAEAIVPYVKAPEQFIPGKPRYYATVVSTEGAAQGVLVESHMGRPTKIEGNPEHPGSRGATDHLAQAEILNLYDPDRSRAILYRTEARTWSDFVAALRPVLEGQKAIQGAGIRILTAGSTSPTLAAQFAAFAAMYPQARIHTFDGVARRNAMDGARLAFGRALQPVYDFGKADVIVSLDADFLGQGGDKVASTRAFASRRSFDAVPENGMNRLYVVESSISLTGANADHRISARPAEVEGVAREIALRLGLQVANGAAPSSPKASSIVAALVKDLQAKGPRSLVLAGESQPAFVHALAYAINEKLGALGSTVRMTEPVEAVIPSQENSVEKLVADIEAGGVDLLVILGGNPAYTTPADVGLVAALRANKVALRVHHGLFDDETAELCHWHVPETHSLESWSDARAFDGTLAVQQPLIAPLYDGKSVHEVVQTLLGDSTTTSYDIVRTAWKARRVPGRGEATSLADAEFEKAWRRAVHDGVVPGSAFPAATAKVTAGAWMSTAPTANGAGLDIAFRLDPNLLDGRFANNGWMQELPRAITRITWDNAAMLSPKTAERLGVAVQKGSARGNHAQMVRLTVGPATLEIAGWIVPGHPDDVVTLHLGSGRRRAGRTGNGVGVNVRRLRTKSSPWVSNGSLEALATKYQIACTQDHWGIDAEGHNVLDGRHLIRTGTYAQFQKEPRFAQVAKEQGPQISMYPEHPYEGHKWGMTIDLSACVGCNACVTACQSENNLAVVGKEQVARGREMHWLRIDRYYQGDLESPEVHHQPVPCMQCENASCEVVCPVAATVHSDDGLNDMVYNRCVGTRYCANNCPYKVRRFNFFLYSEWNEESLKLQRNPDVSVRSRGVMEKCTYCVQRINEARIAAKNDGREGPGGIKDGAIKTACQQVCPASAIHFGDLNDPAADIVKTKNSPRNYVLLHELNTKPRTSYLAGLRNPNPEITPDAPAAAEAHHG
jgi:molybdopterin-containing oxidoreductase family iron-sulfur binding subunit